MQQIRLAQNQIDFVAPFLTSGPCFVGEFRGGDIRETTFDVRDKQGNKTGQQDTTRTYEFLVEVIPADGRPVSKLCILRGKKGETLQPPNCERGKLVFVPIRGMKIDDYAKEHQVMVGEPLQLPEAKVAAREVSVKSPSPALAGANA